MSEHKNSLFKDQSKMVQSRTSIISADSKQKSEVKSKIARRDAEQQRAIRELSQNSNHRSPRPKSLNIKQILKDNASSSAQQIDTDGTDDEAPASYKHQKSDSSSEQDPQFGSISDDGDTKFKMRHILKEQEEQSELRKIAEQQTNPPKPKGRDMVVQTMPTQKDQGQSFEYVAPPSRHEQTNEYQAPEQYEDPDENEYQAPESESEVQHFQVAVTDKKQHEKLMKKYAGKGQGNSPLYIHRNSPSPIRVANDSKLKLKPTQLTTGQRNSNRQSVGTSSPLRRNTGVGSPLRSSGLNSPGQGVHELNNEIKEKSQDLQDMLQRKKELLRQQLDNQRQHNDSAKKQKLLDYKAKLQEVQELQIRQNQQMQAQIRAIQRQMQEAQEEDNGDYREIKPRKRMADMNAQTEGSHEDFTFKHPKALVNNKNINYSPRPFEDIKAAPLQKSPKQLQKLKMDHLEKQPRIKQKQLSPVNIKDYPTFDKDTPNNVIETPTSMGIERQIYSNYHENQGSQHQSSRYQNQQRQSLDTVTERSGMFSAADYDNMRNATQANHPVVTESNTLTTEVRRGQMDPNNLPPQFNLGFMDSASQNQDNEEIEDSEIPSLEQLKNRPFQSNLENAKILAKLTKIRVEKLELTPKKGKIEDLSIENEPFAFQQETARQQKVNKYLTDTMKHLNITIDILIDQYDPIKIKQQSKQQAEEEKEYFSQANKIQRKLEEVKNSEKQLKNTQRELASLNKKYDKVKDWKYLANLYKQVEVDTRRIENIEKDNKKLKTEQKKAELKLMKKLNQKGEHLFGEEINHQELIELDNELNVHRHKAEYMQEKLYKEQQNEKEQAKKLEVLKRQVKNAIQEEQKVIEMGKKLYGIDFDDVEKQRQKMVQGELTAQKDKLLKKIVIIEDSNNSIDKQYATHHRANLKRMNHLREMKRQMEEQLKAQEDGIQDKQRQMKYYNEQKQARDVIMKVRQSERDEAETIQTVRPDTFKIINVEQHPKKIEETQSEKTGTYSTSGYQVSGGRSFVNRDGDLQFMTDDEAAKNKGDKSPLSFSRPNQNLGKKSQKARKRPAHEDIAIIKETLAELDDENLTAINLEEKLKVSQDVQRENDITPEGNFSTYLNSQEGYKDINKINLDIGTTQ